MNQERIKLVEKLPLKDKVEYFLRTGDLEEAEKLVSQLDLESQLKFYEKTSQEGKAREKALEVLDSLLMEGYAGRITGCTGSIEKAAALKKRFGFSQAEVSATLAKIYEKYLKEDFSQGTVGQGVRTLLKMNEEFPLPEEQRKAVASKLFRLNLDYPQEAFEISTKYGLNLEPFSDDISDLFKQKVALYRGHLGYILDDEHLDAMETAKWLLKTFGNLFTPEREDAALLFNHFIGQDNDFAFMLKNKGLVNKEDILEKANFYLEIYLLSQEFDKAHNLVENLGLTSADEHSNALRALCYLYGRDERDDLGKAERIVSHYKISEEDNVNAASSAVRKIIGSKPDVAEKIRKRFPVPDSFVYEGLRGKLTSEISCGRFDSVQNLTDKYGLPSEEVRNAAEQVVEKKLRLGDTKEALAVARIYRLDDVEEIEMICETLSREASE